MVSNKFVRKLKNLPPNTSRKETKIVEERFNPLKEIEKMKMELGGDSSIGQVIELYRKPDSLDTSTLAVELDKYLQENDEIKDNLEEYKKKVL